MYTVTQYNDTTLKEDQERLILEKYIFIEGVPEYEDATIRGLKQNF